MHQAIRRPQSGLIQPDDTCRTAVASSIWRPGLTRPDAAWRGSDCSAVGRRAQDDDPDFDNDEHDYEENGMSDDNGVCP